MRAKACASRLRLRLWCRDTVLVAAQSALGAAMRALGPETVLEALPLDLIEVGAGAAPVRACPLLCCI